MTTMKTLMAGGSLVLLTVTSASATDRIWLKATGDYVEVDSWREKDGKIVYPQYGGEIAVAKSEVLKIEHVKVDPAVEVLSAPKSKLVVAKGQSDDPLATLPAGPGRTELARLKDVWSKEQSELSDLEIKSMRHNTECLERGLGIGYCSRSAASVYQEFIQDHKKRVEDAERRYKDLESKLRAGQ
jgi:hypothetical protein